MAELDIGLRWLELLKNINYMNMIDSIVQDVRKDLQDRSNVGIKKYGVTLDRTDLSLKEWLQHAYEESLDLCIYLRAELDRRKR